MAEVTRKTGKGKQADDDAAVGVGLAMSGGQGSYWILAPTTETAAAPKVSSDIHSVGGGC